MITLVPKNGPTLDKSTKIVEFLEGEKFLSILMVFIAISTSLVILFA